MIEIKNYEAIIRRDLINDWYVLGIKKGYNKYYISLTKNGDMLFKTCELLRTPNADDKYLLKCGRNEYCSLTKQQVGNMNYILECLNTFVN